MLQAFRAISIVEGLSYLLILSITAGMLSRTFVFQVGMAHGLLFLTYLIASLLLANKRGWSLAQWLLLFLASVVPFAFIGVEMVLRKLNHQTAPARSRSAAVRISR